MRIAIDFDGTIVEHKYPAIGREMPFAIQALKELNKKNHHLILWTYRTGKELEDAVNFCRANGVEFYAVNKNFPEEIFSETISRKIDADIYIDDKNFGGFPGWDKIWELFSNKELLKIEEEKGRKISIFKRIFK